MGFWNSVERSAGNLASGVVNGVEKLNEGARNAAKDAWDSAVKAAKTEAAAQMKSVSDLAANVGNGVVAAASDFQQGHVAAGLGHIGEGMKNGAEAYVADTWHGLTGSVSQAWDGLNKAAHDVGGGLKNAYEDATDGMAHAIGSVAGAKAESAFRSGASAVESAAEAEIKLGWGFTEGVAEGAAGMVTGTASLIGGAYKYATDSQYRDGVNTAVEHGAEYVWNHPGEALDKAGAAAKNLAVSAYNSTAEAVKTGNYEAIGKGLGEVTFAVATTVVAPEALLGKAGEVAELAGAAGRAAEGAEVLSAAGRGAELVADAGKVEQKGAELASLEAKASSGLENCGRRTVEGKFGCFVQGTLVHTRDGLTPIERLRAGDMVLSQPEFTGERGYRRVNETFVFEDKAIFEIAYRDGQGRTERVLATPNHPFWVKDVGWTGAEYLEDGQVLELSDGRDAQVASVRDTGEKRRVYNFEVDGFHTYYVGERGVWVHNTNCGSAAEGAAEEAGQATGDTGKIGDAAKVVGKDAFDATKVTVKDIPTFKSGDFNAWFDARTPEELATMYKTPALRAKIETGLRGAGSNHEFLMVAEAPQWSKWGVNAKMVQEDFAIPISDLNEGGLAKGWTHSTGLEGSRAPGSKMVHNQLQAIIQESKTLEEFKTNIAPWAERWITGGYDALPRGFHS